MPLKPVPPAGNAVLKMHFPLNADICTSSNVRYRCAVKCHFNLKTRWLCTLQLLSITIYWSYWYLVIPTKVIYYLMKVERERNVSMINKLWRWTRAVCMCFSILPINPTCLTEKYSANQLVTAILAFETEHFRPLRIFSLVLTCHILPTTDKIIEESFGAFLTEFQQDLNIQSSRDVSTIL